MTLYVALSNFFSAPIFKPVREKCRAALLSYADFVRAERRQVIVLDEMRKKGTAIFLDSGAFAAKHSGLDVSLDKYIAFVKANPDLKTYANLDVIGDPKGTLVNQKKMEKAGLSPIPVFHYGEPWKYFEDYLKNYDYVGFGGVSRKHMSHIGQRFLRECWQRITDKWPKKIHGFGINSRDLLMAYPFYSVDASSATRNAGLGVTWHFDKGEMRQVRSDTGPQSRVWVRNMHMRGRGSAAVIVRALHNLDCVFALEDFVNKSWKERGVTWK